MATIAMSLTSSIFNPEIAVEIFRPFAAFGEIVRLSNAFMAMTWIGTDLPRHGWRAMTMMKTKTRMLAVATLGLALGLGACTDPYDPGQRAVGGGLLGAGAGAAIGGLAGGGRGAAIGALSGGVLGAGAGAVTTPQRPAYGY